MRRGEGCEHREVLARAELVAQALRLFGPHLSKARPQRFLGLEQVPRVRLFAD